MRMLVVMLAGLGLTAADPISERTDDTWQSLPDELAVEFTSGVTTLNGSLVLPNGEGPFPALVFVHGSGDGPRSDFRMFAEHFAQVGIANLIYDKRGSGESSGSWVTSSLTDLAGDVVAAIEAAGRHRMIDPDRIGVWAISQGSWVTSVASWMTDDLAFALIVTGGGVKPRDSELFAYRNRLTAAGIPQDSQADALAIVNVYFDYLAGDLNQPALEARLEAVRDEAWYDVLGLERMIPSEAERDAWSWVATFDPVQTIAEMRMPVLVLLGAHDQLTPLDLAEAAWTKGLQRAGNDDFTIRVFADAGHGITVGGHDVPHGSARTYADEYFEVMTTWLIRQTER